MREVYGQMQDKILAGYNPFPPDGQERVVQHNPAMLFAQPQRFPAAGPGEPQQVIPAPQPEEQGPMRSVLEQPRPRRGIGLMDGVEDRIRQLRDRFSR